MRRLAIICCALAGFAGCSQRGDLEQPAEPEQLWQQTQQVLQTYNQWDLQGRAVVRLPGAVYQIGLQWQRTPEQFLFLLEAPFGQGIIRMEKVNPALYRLRLPGGQVYLDRSPEALLENATGWSIPLQGLDYWIRGLPRPGPDYSYSVDAGGKTHTIDQDGWSVRYLDYSSSSELPALPRRLSLERDDIQMRLVIDRWQAELIQDNKSEWFPEFH